MARHGRAGRSQVVLLSWLLGALALTPAAAGAPGTGEGEQPPPGAEAAAERQERPVKTGVDYYLGITDRAGERGFTDGYWAGSAPAYPSVTYVTYNGRGGSGKLSVGVGRMYAGSASTLNQPVEAWWQIPVGGLSITLGKHWVPFALQEWEYETKWGAMAQWSSGRWGVAASATHNPRTHSPNAYLRAAYNLGDHGDVGLSVGSGKGLSYDSDHDRAWALDASLGWRNWRLTGEALELQHVSGRCTFVFGKLAYEGLGRWTPYIATYTWNDRSGSLGRLHSTAYGLNLQVTPELALESCYAVTSDRAITWVQAHWTWER